MRYARRTFYLCRRTRVFRNTCCAGALFRDHSWQVCCGYFGGQERVFRRVRRLFLRPRYLHLVVIIFFSNAICLYYYSGKFNHCRLNKSPNNPFNYNIMFVKLITINYTSCRLYETNIGTYVPGA